MNLDCIWTNGYLARKCIKTHFWPTSSSLSMIIENALKMAVVGPARVMILSGQLPSEMLMRAPLCDRLDRHKICL